MKVAVIGSRQLKIDIAPHIPKSATEIISGGAHGIDRLAEQYADLRGIKKTVLRPDYDVYGKRAPLKRNDLIIELADLIVAVWDGKSRGTKYVIDRANRLGKPVKVVRIALPFGLFE